jgi:hypothetical protein
MFENSVLKRMFESKREEVRREWRKVHNEELNDLHPKPNNFLVTKIETNMMCGSCRTCGGGIRHIQEFGGEN